MKKRILSFFFALTVLVAVAQERSSQFNWSNPTSLTPSFVAPTEANRAGDFVGAVKFTTDDVVFEVDDSNVSELSRRARFYLNYATKQVELRVYSGSYINISAVEGRTISSLVLEGPQSDRYYLDMVSPTADTTYTPTPPVYDRTTWTVPDGTTEVRFYAGERTQLTFTTVTTVDASGVSDITIDDNAAPEWYTLQGRRLLSRPTIPGIYVERTARTTRRILISQ